MENPQTWFANWYVKKHTELDKLQMCFFIVYLLKIITTIIKANTIIATARNKFAETKFPIIKNMENLRKADKEAVRLYI